MKNKQVLNISLIVPVYNVSTIIDKVLVSIRQQEYPLKEIIVIDNHSTDNSVALINKFIRKNKKMKIKLIEQKKTYGISTSYNLGAKLAKGDYVVSLHSDSVLPTSKEITKLVKPFLSDSNVIATYPYVVHLRKTWLAYNFWQKCHFGTVFGTESPSMNGKFDCYKKSVYLKIGGYNEKKFYSGMGTEDADMHYRLKREGKVIPTKAKVIHLHSLEKNYSLKDWIARRKFLAISYGRYVKMHALDMGLETGIFFIKPLFLVSVLFVFVHPIFLLPSILFPFVYYRRMFGDPEAIKDPKIIVLPFILYYLIFYESFWLFQSIVFKNK